MKRTKPTITLFLAMNAMLNWVPCHNKNEHGHFILFSVSPSFTILLLLYSLKHQMCISLQLKIVPNKSTIYFWIINNCYNSAQLY